MRYELGIAAGLWAASLMLCGCSSSPKVTDGVAKMEGLKEGFAGVRVDVEKRVVEFDGTVCIDAADANQPRGVPLEACIVTPMSGKEHEALIVTRAKAKEIHAALLMAGFKSGRPGSFEWDAKNRAIMNIAPGGELVEIQVAYVGHEFMNLGDWMVHINGTAFVPAGAAKARWHFAGSRFVNVKGGEVYDADMTGIIAGLCTFGGEVLAWPDVISADSTMQEPDCVANKEKVPPFNTAVRVRFSAIR